MKEQALKDWAWALWEQLQDMPNNETAVEIIKENGTRLVGEAQAAWNEQDASTMRGHSPGDHRHGEKP